MEFKNTLEVLHSHAREIADIIARLEKSDRLSFIEFDLLMEKLRNIYDLTSDMRLAIQHEHSLHSKKPTGENISETEEKETFENEAGEDDTKNKSSRMLKENVRERIEKDATLVDKNASHTEDKFLSDRFKSSKLTLNEEISGKSKQDDITSQYKSKPIKSIANALGLNERFELINQLFDGNKELFERTMEVLDMAGSFVEAYNYIEEHFQWDMDDPYVQRVLELIRRKLIVRSHE